jgi:iron complex transport system permease protein
MKFLAGGLVLLAAVSLLLGASGFGVPDPVILWQLRVPRSGLALLVGAGLGLSGAVLQGVLRNPLADPGFLGIGGCAALGAVLVFYWGVSARFAAALPLAGLAGAAVGCAVLLLMFARGQSGAGAGSRASSGAGSGSGPGLILAGIGVSAIAAAMLSLALSAAPNPFALYEITFWLMGGLDDRTLTQLALAAPPIALGCALLLRLGPGLDALSLGEDTASSLGLPVAATLGRVVLGVSLAVGAGAAVAGGIGFVGLIVPHLLRPIWGERPGALLAPSMLGGAALLLAADCLARACALWLPIAAEPRLGVLTALLGAPFMIAIARRAAP